MKALTLFWFFVVSFAFAAEVPKEFTFKCQGPDATKYYLVLSAGEKAVVVEKSGETTKFLV